MLDPVPIIVIRAALALLLAASVFQKLRAPALFRQALVDYELLPEALVGPAAWILMFVEGLLVAGLVLGLQIAPAAVAVLLAVYSSAIAINLARGRRDIDCGCGGLYERRGLSGWLLMRNGLLMGAASVATLPVAARSLSWTDALTVVASVLTLALLYLAFEVLAATAPRLKELRRA